MGHEKLDLTHFFAWARARAYREFDASLAANPELDPNWTFSEIMQRLLEEFRRLNGDLDDTKNENDIS
jgi:hypothetical protein